MGDAARVRALLGEVDPGSLDSYRHLDTVVSAAGEEPPAPAPALEPSLDDKETDDEA